MVIHPVFVHFHTGILTAAAAVALVNLLLRILFRDNINTPGTKLARLFHQFDVFIYIGSIIGFLGLIAGMVTGFMEPDYPVDALVQMPIMRFKILWSVVCVEIYLYLMIIRAKMGDRVWFKLSTYAPYAILVIFGGIMMMIMGALGGIAVYGTSILQPILDWIGIPWP
ncbi:MAG: hypothetical protein AM326_10540 [Candidatus Thorarchaeota archaeon SMTZ-45]|nr:MAG: hypothetical protein AM326_10540 [Candidatus Thorarchaeota archaeon SMTZ-45]KXH75586.1 MAG: hypothetical protein AM325_04160 [Candidatus Thorarchaeota archaeon SMTZ1-45]